MAASSIATRLLVRHGLESENPGFSTGAPVLDGPPSSQLLTFSGELRTHHDWLLVEKEDLLIGAASLPAVGRRLAGAAARLYAGLFSALGKRHLYRIWHFVPSINQTDHGLENYRAFCLGRHSAFDDFFGKKAVHRMPAASAVGSQGASLVMWFIAGREPGTFLENPAQIPAYRYPVEYGPRPPCFARATATPYEVFVSGTSSIRGHSTVAPGDVLRQVDVTVENLRLVLGLAALDFSDLARVGSEITVYLRHATDLDRVRARLRESWGPAAESALYLQADICRVELDVEIECRVAQRSRPATNRATSRA